MGEKYYHTYMDKSIMVFFMQQPGGYRSCTNNHTTQKLDVREIVLIAKKKKKKLSVSSKCHCSIALPPIKKHVTAVFPLPCGHLSLSNKCSIISIFLGGLSVSVFSWHFKGIWMKKKDLIDDEIVHSL